VRCLQASYSTDKQVQLAVTLHPDAPVQRAHTYNILAASCRMLLLCLIMYSAKTVMIISLCPHPASS
jgi:hypothetical protein